MIKTLVGIVVFTLNVIFSVNAQMVILSEKSPQETIGIQQNQLNIIHKTLLELPDGVQLSIGLVSKDTVVYVGFKKVENLIQLNHNKDSLFEIGSLTKTFTAYILAQLAVEKKLKLNEPINKYLPFKIPIKIPFIQLANHSSGLSRLPSNILLTMKDQQNPYKYYTETNFEEYLKTMRLNSIPNKESLYSNTGYGVLGFTLSKIENKSFEELIQERICKPNNMLHTSSNFSQLEDQLVKGMDANGKVVPNWEWNSSLKCAGAILSNCTDMVSYLKMNFATENKAVQLAKEETISINENMAVGLGWHIIKNKFLYQIYWHNGRTGGYSSSLVFDDQKKTGIVILSNIATDLLDELCFQLLEFQND